MTRLVGLLLLVGLAAPAVASPSLTPQASLDQGKVLYQHHDYKEVEETVKPLLYPTIELGTEDAVIEAHRLLALSYFFQKKMPEARQEVLSVFAMRPGFQLDSFVEPPTAVGFFEAIHREQDVRLQEIRRRQMEEEVLRIRDEARRRVEARAKAERVFVEKQVFKHSRAIAMLPFGIGQAQNGQTTKAVLFGVGEATLGALSLASWISIGQLYPKGTFAARDTGTATTLTGLQLASGAAFWVLVAWGIIDAQVKFVPETIKTRELPAGPPKDSGKKISLTPLLSPGFYGLGAGGAF